MGILYVTIYRDSYIWLLTERTNEEQNTINSYEFNELTNFVGHLANQRSTRFLSFGLGSRLM